MPTIAEILRNRKYKVRVINKKKRYLILLVEDVHPCLYVPFNSISTKVLFELTSGMELSGGPTQSCNGPGEQYGRTKDKTKVLKDSSLTARIDSGVLRQLAYQEDHQFQGASGISPCPA
jgi:hypothetical protein